MSLLVGLMGRRLCLLLQLLLLLLLLLMLLMLVLVLGLRLGLRLRLATVRLLTVVRGPRLSAVCPAPVKAHVPGLLLLLLLLLRRVLHRRDGGPSLLIVRLIGPRLRGRLHWRIWWHLSVGSSAIGSDVRDFGGRESRVGVVR